MKYSWAGDGKPSSTATGNNIGTGIAELYTSRAATTTALIRQYPPGAIEKMFSTEL